MRFVAKLLQHWYLYLIPMLIIPLLATYYGEQTLKVYESSALLYIQDSSSTIGVNISGFNQYASPAQNGADAMLELMQSETFGVTVAAVTDLANEYDLTTRYGQDAAYTRLSSDINIYPTAVGTNTVQVVADDKEPKIAQQIVAGVITVFADYFSSHQLTLDKKTEQFLQNQIKGAQTQVSQDENRIQAYLNAHPGVSPSNGLDPTLASLEQQYQQDAAALQSLNQKLSTVQFDEAAALTGNSQVFTVLDQPKYPLGSTLHLKKLAVYPAVGLGIALALIILIVGLLTVLDRRVYTTRDLKAIAEALEMEMVPPLLSIPELTGVERNGGQGDDLLSGMLVPVLAVLPQQDDVALNHELRRAVGVMVDDE
jgi:uncharacterized protein involved in exopolysaccharide biosynthesis